MPACATNKPLGFPSDLVADCKETPVTLETNGDIVLAYRSARQDLKVCNADKAALRGWAEDNGLMPKAK